MTIGEDDRALQRFTVMVEHLLDHTKSHATELEGGRALFAPDAPALPLLDKALAELGTAHASLEALLGHVDGGRTAGDGHRLAHGHAHDHSHEHGNGHAHPHS